MGSPANVQLSGRYKITFRPNFTTTVHAPYLCKPVQINLRQTPTLQQKAPYKVYAGGNKFVTHPTLQQNAPYLCMLVQINL